MGNAFDLPQALWKANLELQQRIGRLIQDSGRDWVDLGTRAVGEGAAEFDSEWRELLRSGDWQALAALPVDAFWRQAEQRLGDSQAWLQIAANAQDNFVGGLQRALQDWQQQTTEAWTQASGGLEGFTLPVATFSFAVGEAAAPAAAKKTQARKSPAKKAAATKAAPRKTASKKSPAGGKGGRKRGG